MTERVGILIETVDKASAVLAGIGKAGKGALEGIRSAGSKAGSALKAVGMAATFLNQAMELAKKGFEIFRMLILENVRAMIEYRGEADSVAKKFKEIADEAAYTRAVIADLLTPVIFGLADAWKETGSSLVDYINTNRRLIATNIVDFLVDTAEILIKGVAMGAEAANRAVSGLVLVWDVLKIGVNKAIGGILTGLFKLLDAMVTVAVQAGNLDLAKSINEARDAVWGLNAEFKKSADNAKTDLAEHVAGMEKREAMIERFRGVALTFTGEARASMLAWADSWDGVKRKVEETEDTVKKTSEVVKPIVAQMSEEMRMYVDAMAEITKGAATAITDFGETATNKLTAFAQSTAKIIGQLLAKVLSAKIAAAITESTITKVTATQEVTAKAATAAAGAASSQASIPVVGPILAAAASAAMMGLVMGLLGTFQHGGMVGGPSGVDNLLGRLSAGERVIDSGRTEKLNRWIDSLGTVGKSTPQGGGMTVQIQAPISNPEEMTDAQIKRWFVRAAKPIEELFDDGLVFRGMQRA